MASSVSGLSPIATYKSIIKDESTRVSQYVKSNAQVQRTVSQYETDSVNISSSTDILSSKNYSALTVVTGANNISGQISETGLLRTLLTEDSSASNSLVKSLGSTDDLNFVKSMTARSTVSMDFGTSTDKSFTSGGSSASTLSVNNIYWSKSDSSLTASDKAESWSYVLDNGSGSASIASALTTLADYNSSSSSSSSSSASYSVNSSGQIVGSDGAPSVSTSTDSAGNTVYSITLASDSSGDATRTAQVVAVKTSSASSASTLTAGDATTLLSKAMTATGFDVSTGSSGSSLNIINPISNGTQSLSTESYSSYLTTASSAISTSQSVLALGDAGKALSAGQVLLSGSTEIGTVKSVDAQGNVTLTAASKADVSSGSEIEVAIGAGLSNIGTTFTASSAVASGTTTLALGTSASSLQAGQTITDGSSVVGVVKSVDASGNVTLTSASAVAIKSGDTLSVVPKTTDTTTAALSDSSNVSSLATSYETNQYEKSEGKQVSGLDDALYFTRTASSASTLDSLMSDSTLLKVIVTDLGISSTYYDLSFSQQKAVLSSKLDVSTLSDSKTVQKYAEQYLVKESEASSKTYDATQIGLALLSGTATSDSSSSSSTDSSDTGSSFSSLLGALYPDSGTSSTSGLSGILKALYG